MESFAAHVTRRRTELALTPEELARKVGIHRESVRQIENGERPRVHESTAIRLAAALDEPYALLKAIMSGDDRVATDAIVPAPGESWVIVASYLEKLPPTEQVDAVKAILANLVEWLATRPPDRP